MNTSWQVEIDALGAFAPYRFTVIFAHYRGEWLYARHKNRDTYETAGGHVEPGETPLECAKRELVEETGAVKFSIEPAFDYAVHTEKGSATGQVFYAEVKQLGKLPEGSEMAEVRLFPGIPKKMTYPAVLPVLYEEMRTLLLRGNDLI